MCSLKSKNLLLIVPHLRAFIADQAAFVRPHFNEITALMPISRFSKVALALPFLNRYFRFLELAIESRNEPQFDYTILSPEFFTLPLEVLRKRNGYLAARSCIKTLSKNGVNIDLIHAHFLTTGGFVGAALKGFYDKPLVVTAHGGDVYDIPFKGTHYRALIRYILEEADNVITVSQYNRQILLSLGVQSKKLSVIPSGYNDKLFGPMPSHTARTKLGLPYEKEILLSVGNLEDVKGHVYLIDAMRIVSRIRKNVLLIIVGSGPLKEKLRNRIDKLGLKQKILLTGGKKHAEIPIWMNSCDIFVLPSLNEGFPTVLSEAMACGKPVVGTKVGGVPEAVTNDNLGFLVNPKDSEALASAILEAMDKKWSQEIILKHAKQYSLTNLAKHVLRIYEEILFDMQHN